ncbi:MAG TPA: hypothetical protein DCL41_00245 [Bdellovibrionales bacterium]|nr:hypothetical protein [Pseudobdellovibrionaceae bacterium]HAG90267.1 hypothetical protein [Bdellovibrionales bacterium]
MKIRMPSNDVEKKLYETFIRNQNTCPLCNSILEIKAVSYLENYTLREEATCPKCKVMARSKDHKMH